MKIDKLKVKACHFRSLCYFILLLPSISFSQDFNYGIELKIDSITPVPPLQSFAWARLDQKILMIGGRRDGLHKRQPVSAFSAQDRNDSIYILLEDQSLLSAPLTGLSDSLEAQLSSTNMQYCQVGEYLYLSGGYGYFPPLEEHITFDALIRTHIPSLINKIIQGHEIVDNDFDVIRDSSMAVTGGDMHPWGDHLILLCGQKFDGFYNPAGNPSFTQKYNESIIEFQPDFDNGTIEFFKTLHDSTLLHRRDLNTCSIKDSTGDNLTIFSGVFRPDRNQPFQTILKYQNGDLKEVAQFRQSLSNYHGANLHLGKDFPIPSFANGHLFFGGLAMYYFQGDSIIYDTDVPFVSQISMVLPDRDKKSYSEYHSQNDLPYRIGTGAVFIPNEDFSQSDSRIFLGSIFGGIYSKDLNVFWSDDDDNSFAFPHKIDVYFKKGSEAWNKFQISESFYQVDIYPDADFTHFIMEWNQNNEKVLIEFSSMDGKKLFSQYFDTDKHIHQKLVLPDILMQHKALYFHFKGKEEFYYTVMNND